MKAYIAKLQAESAEANSQREAASAKRQGADPRVLCDKPLTDQILELLATLPSVQRDRPWSMEQMVALLHGKFSARPHAMNVGRAMRVLGWERRRDYTIIGGGRRMWYKD